MAGVEEGTWGFIIALGFMLLIAPTSLTQYGHRARRAQRGEFRAAMLQNKPENRLQRGPVLLGLGLALTYAIVVVIVLSV